MTIRINSKIIKQIMLDKNFKSVYIANKIGMSRQGWANALSRNTLPDIKLPLLASALGVYENKLIINEHETIPIHESESVYKMRYENCQEELNMAKELIEQLKRDQKRSDQEIDNLKNIVQKERHTSSG